LYFTGELHLSFANISKNEIISIYSWEINAITKGSTAVPCFCRSERYPPLFKKYLYLDKHVKLKINVHMSIHHMTTTSAAIYNQDDNINNSNITIIIIIIIIINCNSNTKSNTE